MLLDERDGLGARVVAHVGHHDVGPSSANRSQHARPMPLAPPVTTATLPSSRPMPHPSRTTTSPHVYLSA